MKNINEAIQQILIVLEFLLRDTRDYSIFLSILPRYYRFTRCARTSKNEVPTKVPRGLAKGTINSDLRFRYALCVVPIYQPVLSLVAKQRLYAYLTSARVGILRGTPTG